MDGRTDRRMDGRTDRRIMEANDPLPVVTVLITQLLKMSNLFFCTRSFPDLLLYVYLINYIFV